MLKDTPAPMRLLGLAGLIPFWAFALAIAFGPKAYAPAEARAIEAYGATILSFLGGVHWGVAVAEPRAANWSRLGWGVTPSLIAWAALLAPGDYGIAILIFGLAAAFGVDRRMFAGATGYRALRVVLTAGAVAALLLALAARRVAES